MAAREASDGRLRGGSAAQSAADFLRSHRGAYAALAARRGEAGAEWGAECWQRHCGRLAASAATLLAAQGQGGGALEQASAWRSVARAAAPSVRAALGALPGGHTDALVVVLLELATAEEAAKARRTGGLPIRGVRVHARVLSQGSTPDVRRPPAAATVVASSGRELPTAKDAAWASRRQPLEAARDAARADEGLLTTPEGELLEGLVSNLLVVRRREGCGPPDLASALEALWQADSWADATHRACGVLRWALWRAAVLTGLRSEDDALEVITAPADDVLPGVTRALALEAAVAEGLRVREVAPSPADAGCWSEAALTSALRVLQPLRSISWSEWRGEPLTARLDASVTPVVDRLRARVAAAMRNETVLLPRLEDDTLGSAASAGEEELTEEGYVAVTKFEAEAGAR